MMLKITSSQSEITDAPVLFYFLFLFLMYFLYFVIWSDSPYELPCHEYEYFVLLYFFKICTLFGQSIRTSMQNLESLAQKLSVLCSIYYSLPFPSSSALRSRLCLKASRQGHLLHHQISPVPDVPQISFTPQNVAINQGIHLRVIPTSQDTHG